MLCKLNLNLLLLRGFVVCLQEEEAEQMMAPEDFASEEERLRQKREAAFAAEAAEVSKAVRQRKPARMSKK